MIEFLENLPVGLFLLLHIAVGALLITGLTVILWAFHQLYESIEHDRHGEM